MAGKFYCEWLSSISLQISEKYYCMYNFTIHFAILNYATGLNNGEYTAYWCRANVLYNGTSKLLFIKFLTPGLTCELNNLVDGWLESTSPSRLPILGLTWEQGCLRSENFFLNTLIPVFQNNNFLLIYSGIH